MAKNIPFNIKISVDGQEMVVKSIRYVKDFGQEIDITRSSAQRLSDSMQNLANTAMALQGMTGAISQISNVLNSVTEESRSFDAAMKAANTMAGKDAEGFKDLKSQVSELSKTIPLTRDELANGLYQVISNGVPENNWIDYLNASSRAAVGGIADVGEVVKVTSTIIKNYGLEWSAAQDIQDKIQLTAKNGVTSFEQLAAALPSVTGQAAQLGVSFTEMLAVMSTLTGVTGNTSEVATQLSSVLTALTKESSKAQKMAAEMGIEFNAASIKAAGGLQQFLVQLDQTISAYAQRTGELKESIYSKLFGRAEALRLTNALTGQLAGKFAENIEQLEDSAGTISEAFDTMASTGASKIQTMRNWLGSLTDGFASFVSGAQPALTVISQMGLTAASVAMLAKSIKDLNLVQKVQIATSKTSVVATMAQSASNKIAAAATALWANQVRFANRMQIAWTFGAKRFVIQAIAMRAAIMGLMAISGVGLVIMAVSSIMSAMAGKADDAASSLGNLSGEQDKLKSSTEALDSVYNSTLSDTYADLISKYEQLKKAWKSLTSEQEKVAWIRNNQSLFDDLSASINSVSEAENYFEKNTDIVVEGFNRRAKAAAYAAKLTELYKRQIELSSKAEEIANNIKKDAEKKGRSARAGEEIKDPTFWNKRYGSAKSGTWRFSEQGAKLYSGENSSTSEAMQGVEREMDDIDKQISDTLGKINEFSKEISDSTSGRAKNVDTLKMSYKELGDEITKQKDEVARLAGKDGMEKEAFAAAKKLQQMEARYKELGRKYGLSSGGSAGGGKKAIVDKPKTQEQLRNNIDLSIKKLTGEDNEEQKKIRQNIAMWQREIDIIELRNKELNVPEELKSLDDVAKKMDYLTAKRKLASDSEIADVDREIAATEKKQKVIEMASAVQIDDSRISTYSELNKKREYYNYLVNEGTEDEIKAGRAGLDALDKVQKKLDEIGKVPPPLENLSTLQEYDAAIQFYTDRQQKEDADNIQKTQEEIDRLTKGRDAIQLGMKLPSMQKEVADIMDLPKKEYTIKVRGIGFDGLTDKIRELSKELDNPNLTKSQRQQIEELRDEYKKMRHDAVMSFSTLASGWESVKGIGSSIENLSSAMDDNASAWQKITSVVDAFMQVYNGISEIVGIINMLTEATIVSKTAKEEEAGASVASLAASTAEAGEQSAIAAAKVPVIAANKAATASFVELAAAEYMAAHASIPFAGFAIGSGFTTSMATLVKSMGLMAFAQGAIISGPTLGLIGEYAGASSNPEVVAPLDKLRSLIQTPQVSLPPGSIVGKVQGTDILLVASRASLIHSKSGRKTTIR